MWGWLINKTLGSQLEGAGFKSLLDYILGGEIGTLCDLSNGWDQEQFMRHTRKND